MKPQFENIPLVKNEDKKRFEIESDGHFANQEWKRIVDQRFESYDKL
ncbi:hypothetical protein ACFQO9_06025 [Chryseobacterium zhengzhouense]|uniref:Uncharacterized protein n=1 Tax=Chryseobacterium zhengzhouense TaxID=1636086 RepID=A0ABW2LYD5_9FLAO